MVQNALLSFQGVVRDREKETTQAKLLASPYDPGLRAALLQFNESLRHVLVTALSDKNQDSVLAVLEIFCAARADSQLDSAKVVSAIQSYLSEIFSDNLAIVGRISLENRNDSGKKALPNLGSSIR